MRGHACYRFFLLLEQSIRVGQSSRLQRLSRALDQLCSQLEPEVALLKGGFPIDVSVVGNLRRLDIAHDQSVVPPIDLDEGVIVVNDLLSHWHRNELHFLVA